MSFVDGLRRLFGAGSGAARSSARPDRVIACSAVAPETPRIVPTLAAALGPAGKHVPAALVAQKARLISEGVMAALEQASTNGDGEHPGVVRWLEQLERELAAGGEAGETAQLGHVHDEVDCEAALERVRAALSHIARTGSTRRAVAQRRCSPTRSVLDPSGSTHGAND